MPGLITHYLFGQDIIKLQLTEPAFEIIARYNRAFNLGLQGPDIFFYNLKDVARLGNKNLGSYMHRYNTGNFFANYINLVKETDGITRDVNSAYIYGFLCHYALDTMTHPYIYYMSEFKTEHAHEKNMSSASHRQFETNIDSALLDLKFHKSSGDFNRKEAVFITPAEEKIIAPVLKEAIKLTYNRDYTEYFYYRTFKNARICNTALQDIRGHRKKVIKCIENLTVHYNPVSSMILDDSLPDRYESLNLSGKTWSSPWDKNISSRKSFVDLYDSALVQAGILLSRADEVLNWGFDTNYLLGQTGSRSYHTGLDCTKKCDFVNFRNSSSPLIN